MASTVVSLGDVAEFIRGISFKPDDVAPLGTPGTVACLRTSNVQAELDLSDVWAVPRPFVKRAEQLVQPGDILVSSANSWNLVGKCCWIPELPWQTSFGGFVSVLRPNPNKVEPRFLYRWFASGPIQALLRSFGRQTTNISNLNIERSRQLQLPLPPLPEQRRIAAILDKADELRAKRRTALAQLNGLTRSVFLEMFGDTRWEKTRWPIVPLEALVRETRLGLPVGAGRQGS
jgi:type I restriction enzyme S subunit